MIIKTLNFLGFGYNLFYLFTNEATPLNAFLAVMFAVAIFGNYITSNTKKQA